MNDHRGESAATPGRAGLNRPAHRLSNGAALRISLFVRHSFFAALAALGAAPSARGEGPAGLANLAARGPTGPGAAVLVGGFVIPAGPARPIVIRAVGPGLAKFGLTGFATDPALTLFNSSGATLAANDDWISADATTTAAVGAFALTAGSKDALLVRSLASGAYTAQVTNTGAGSIVLLEVYDSSAGRSALVNLSARAQVGAGASALIPGLVVPPGPLHRLLVRVAGPALATFAGLGADTLVDPVLTFFNNDTKAAIATNDNWDATNDRAVYSGAFAQAGAFPFAPGSKDAALLVDLGPGSYTAQVTGAGGSSGLALVEVYDLTPASPTTVSLTASDAAADETGANPATVRVTRSGELSAPLTVHYSVGGSATPGVDYEPLPGAVTIPAGAASAEIAIVPLADVDHEPAETVTLTLAPNLAYFINASATATAAIANSATSLFLATLRPEPAAGASIAAGSATIVLSASGTVARVTVSYSNLSSPVTAAYLRLGAPGAAGAYLVALPPGQTASVLWNVPSTDAESAADTVNAIKSGLVYLSVPTASFPTGELRGTFAAASGAQTFTPPGAPPALEDPPLTAAAAARFLVQATFGPTQADIDSLIGAHLADLDRWITAQIAAPATSHLDATRADYAAEKLVNPSLRRDPDLSGYTNRRAAWWKIALGAGDQLRQRVAFALSELFVISDLNNTVYDWAEPAAHYYDLLARGALGNFRDLLEQVTLNPLMGVYLSSVKNARADGRALPDENFAREVMQLFTVGLHQLQPDGTLRLDATSLPIAVYDQAAVTEMARVFTGWGFFQTVPDATFRSGGGRIENFMNPMQLYPPFHDDGAKTIVGGVTLPANQGGAADLKVTLDTLFTHPNTAPFISRQLIQRLVTGNPSPGYVYRVAQIFSDNGSGVRGDLGAVVRAILLDYEARSPAAAAHPGFGHLKEPLLRVTALMRALQAASNNGRFTDSKVASPDLDLAQAPLRSPSVFNFFAPDYVQPGALAAAALVAPEYQILTGSTAITGSNYFFTLIHNTRPFDSAATTLYLNYDALLPNARNPAALLDQLDVLFCSGALPPAARDRIAAMLGAMPAGASDLDRVRNALFVVVTTAAAAVQK